MKCNSDLRLNLTKEIRQPQKKPTGLDLFLGMLKSGRVRYYLLHLTFSSLLFCLRSSYLEQKKKIWKSGNLEITAPYLK